VVSSLALRKKRAEVAPCKYITFKGVVSLLLCQSAMADVTKYHRMGVLNNRNVLSHGSGGWKSEVKVLRGPDFL
jgi:hypothetical protein